MTHPKFPYPLRVQPDSAFETTRDTRRASSIPAAGEGVILA
jgi:hypothetical protein